MTAGTYSRTEPQCIFCGAYASEADTLIEGTQWAEGLKPYICDRCVTLCVEEIAKKKESEGNGGGNA